jgi:hypothetical protein
MLYAKSPIADFLIYIQYKDEYYCETNQESKGWRPPPPTVNGLDFVIAMIQVFGSSVVIGQRTEVAETGHIH